MLKQILDTVRRNHALEHATITLMLAKHGPMRVVGRAGTDGFFVWANVPTDRLREFADEALMRLQRGESGLAVTPLCGTNIAVAGILAGTAAYVAARNSRGIDGVSRAITAAIVALIASQPVGRMVQQHYTTRPDLDGVRIVSVDPIRHSLHKVRTAAA